MPRFSIGLVLLVVGCGPPAATSETEASSTSSSSETSQTGGTETSDTETSDTETSDTETSDTETSDTETSDTGDPNCPTELFGMVEIDDQSDLEMFACAEFIQWLYVEGSFASLDFLSALRRSDHIDLRAMPNLSDLGGLGSLEEVDELWLYDLPELVDLGGLPEALDLDRLVIRGGNDSLSSIAMGPEGATYLSFGGWDQPELEILQTASPAPTRITISGADLLTDLDDIADCCLAQQASLSLRLADTPLLSDLQGLEPFTELLGFSLGHNPQVSSLAGLQNLAVVTSLKLDGECDPNLEPGILADLQGLAALTQVEFLDVSYQDSLISLVGLPTDVSVGIASFYGNEQLDQALVDAWIAEAGPQVGDSCGNLNGPPCEGICPQ